MARSEDALRLVEVGAPDEPVVIILSVSADNPDMAPNVEGKPLGEKRRALRAWRESLKRDLMVYLQAEQDGQAAITNPLPGTSKVIVKAPKRWWRKELSGDGRLASMSLGLTPNDKTVRLIN